MAEQFEFQIYADFSLQIFFLKRLFSATLLLVKDFLAGFILIHKRPKDKPQRRVVREIRNHPVNKNENAVLHSHQQNQVQTHPHEPGKKSLEFYEGKINYRLVLA